MIGRSYWSTGISLTWHAPATLGKAAGWSGTVEFLDDGFANDSVPEAISTNGVLSTRYIVHGEDSDQVLTAVIDTLKRDAERLLIQFRVREDIAPSLYIRGDGEDPDYPPPPNWRALLRQQANRIGWRTYVAETVV